MQKIFIFKLPNIKYTLKIYLQKIFKIPFKSYVNFSATNRYFTLVNMVRPHPPLLLLLLLFFNIKKQILHPHNCCIVLQKLFDEESIRFI